MLALIFSLKASGPKAAVVVPAVALASGAVIFGAHAFLLLATHQWLGWGQPALFVALAASLLTAAEMLRVRAELQLLQAQIEPHFLFNTLATLRGLVRQQSSLALPLLDRTTAFLEAVLPEVRTADSTLGRELHIVEQYLAIMALRLGPRLRYRIEVDPVLHALTLPPLLLQPLVENAIVHGIEPCESGGELLLQAIRSTQGLQLCVRNSGQPLRLRSPQAGQGLALANLRQRLQALYGHTAEFHLRALSEGTEASLSLPLSPKAQTVS